LKITYWQN